MSLIQEELLAQPHGRWRLLVGCVLLNRTRGVKVRQVIGEVFGRWPDPVSLAAADLVDLRTTLAPLGLQRERANRLVELSQRWRVRRPRSSDEVTALPGCGRYAAASWAIIVEGRTDVETDDPSLLRHLAAHRS